MFDRKLALPPTACSQAASTRGWAPFWLGAVAFIILSDTVIIGMERSFCKMSVVLTLLPGLTVLLFTAPAHQFGGRHSDAPAQNP